MPLPTPPLPLDAIVARAERLLALSPADVTSIAWIESARGTALDSARARRADSGLARAVTVRLRLAGRTGSARTDGAEPGELEMALRLALAGARAAAPSPDGALGAAGPEPERLGGLVDPEITGLDAGSAAARLERLADKRTTLRLRWTDARVAVVGSFHRPRAAAATEVTLEARTGRRPGSGFAAATARSFRDLAERALIERARALEAPAVVESGELGARPLLLSPEAAAVLVEALARRALAASSRPPAGEDAAGELRFGPSIALADLPLDGPGAPFPFDLDGVARRSLDFVERGRRLAIAYDLDLAARAGATPLGHGLAADDAWPLHLCLHPGAASEDELLAASAGGLRIGSLEELDVAGERPFAFSAIARSVRRIGEDGRLGEAIPPLRWSSSLLEVFGSVEALGSRLVAWAPRPFDGLGAPRAPAARLAPLRGLSSRPQDR